jgi:hypothetical protein
MALLDIIINTLKINCSVVQCTGYASDIEALFYLFFFPTVFIILFIYIVIGVVIDKAGGKEGGLRLLVSVALYAFIVFQGYYNLFVSLSRLWWILLATLVGLWIFIRTMIHGRKGGATGSPMSGIKERGTWENFKKATGLDINLDLVKQAASVKQVKDAIGLLEKEIKVQEDKRNAPGVSDREKTEFARTISELEKVKTIAQDKLENLKKLKKEE